MTETKERSAVQGSFTLERSYPASVERLYAAFATPDGKARWFSGPDGWKLVIREMDFRVGGAERVKGRFASGVTSDFQARYHDIVPGQRLVYVYDMYVDDRKISVSLATLVFKAKGAGSSLTITEQGVFLDGYDDNRSREHGTGLLLDAVGKSLAD